MINHGPVGRLAMGGDRCASTACWQPTLGLPVEALAVAEELPFDAGALITTRAAVRHLARGATRPLRRGRTRWMPTALGSVIWESRQEASSRPGQGVAGREEGSASRTEGPSSRKPDRRFRRLT